MYSHLFAAAVSFRVYVQGRERLMQKLMAANLDPGVSLNLPNNSWTYTAPPLSDSSSLGSAMHAVHALHAATVGLHALHALHA